MFLYKFIFVVKGRLKMLSISKYRLRRVKKVKLGIFGSSSYLITYTVQAYSWISVELWSSRVPWHGVIEGQRDASAVAGPGDNLVMSAERLQRSS